MRARAVAAGALGVALAAAVAEGGVRAWLAASGQRLPSYGAARAPSWTLPSGGEARFDDRYVHDPVVGWRNRPRAEAGVTVGADGRRVVPAGRGPVVRVLGDSFTFGLDVPDAAVWVAQLAGDHPDLSVLNDAVPGYGPGQMVLGWEATAAAPRADVVVLALLRLDLQRAGVDHFFNPKPRFVAVQGRLEVLGQPVPTPAAAVAATRWRSRARDLLAGVVAARRPTASPTEVTALLVARFAAGVRAAGGAPVVLGLPSGAPHDADDRWVEAVCGEADVVCVSAYEALGQPPPEGWLGDGGHWRAGAHAAMADFVGARVGAWLPAASGGPPAPAAPVSR